MALRRIFVYLLVLTACEAEFDTTRDTSDRGTVGEEVYRAFCERAAADELPSDVSGEQTRELCTGRSSDAPTPRMAELAQQRDRIVGAIDAIAPEPELDPIDTFLLSIVPFYDPPEAALPEATRAIASLFRTIRDDENAMEALERLGQRRGYRPLARALGVLRPALAYPQIRELTTQVLDATSEGGAAHEEWQALLAAAAMEMAAAEAQPSEGESTLELTRELLFQEDESFGVGGALLVARRDHRGIVMPSSLGAANFADSNSDGLADVDQLGRFIDASGIPLRDLPTPFRLTADDTATRNPSGVALNTRGEPIFQTLDVADTLLAGLIHETVPLLEEPALLDAAFALPALLGQRGLQTARVGTATVTFDGFDGSTSPLLDLVHALSIMFRDPAISDVLSAVSEASEQDPESLARLARAGLFGRNLAAANPDVALDPSSNLFDDLFVVLGDAAGTPGLVEGLLRAIADPRSRYLGQVFSEMMRYRDAAAVNPGNINEVQDDVAWTQLVDHSRSEGDDNRSLFQQSVAIIHDLSGVTLCNKAGARVGLTIAGRYIRLPGSYDECELMEIRDVAVTYQQAIIGRARIEIKPAFLSAILDLGGSLGLGADEVLERESGIRGLTTRPTAEALSRLVFAPRNQFLNDLIGDPLTRDGVPLVERHDPITIGWERKFRFCNGVVVEPGAPCSNPEEVSFFDAMTPLLTAFDDFEIDRGVRRDLFSRMVTAIYTHWGSPQDPRGQSTNPSAPFFSYLDNARAYEPMASAVLGDCVGLPGSCDTGSAGGLFRALHDLLRTLDGIQLRPGVDAIDALAQSGEYLLNPRLHSTLQNRRGESTSPTSAGDGVLPITPLVLLTDALREVDRAWISAPNSRDAWRDARGVFAEHFLKTTISGSTLRFESRRLLPILRMLISFLQERIEVHERAGDLVTWTGEFVSNVEALLNSPLGASAVLFAQAVQDDQASTDALTNFATYLLENGRPEDAWKDSLIAAADLLQVLEDDDNLLPLLRTLSSGLSPLARDHVEQGDAVLLSSVTTESSLLDATTLLLRRTNEADEANALSGIFARLVTIPPGGRETPLETLVDAAAEIERAEPGAGSPLLYPDYELLFESVIQFMENENNGLERIYDVIQAREL